MTREEMIEQLENTILLIKQNGKDWVDERDIPILEEAMKSIKTETCEDCISFPKGTLKKRGEDYVVYNVEWLKEHWRAELEVMGIKCEGCISIQTVKEQMLKYGFQSLDMTSAEFVETLSSVQPEQQLLSARIVMSGTEVRPIMELTYMIMKDTALFIGL